MKYLTLITIVTALLAAAASVNVIITFTQNFKGFL